MTISIQIEKECGKHVEPILRALPEWFGIEKATLQYIKDADTMPTMLVRDEGEVIGFLTIHMHFPETAEIHCMGILPQFHRQGIGKLMCESLELYLKKNGALYLQVKTLAEQRECEEYERTRKFYLAMGFSPLEVFPTLWDESNPCLVMVKSLV
ncbi:MAG: GNAT family N-acetyltransferase [Phycisphaerales bacterium]|jgi:ribosomal protein S18 acetylase RimI-like enzyme|nr:GNAT family N-acetyltransferase [Phycisphaerales bacterium]|tara:strand:+ start:374 stop:835 length:462 start_codon:yes stop_codon:yes gene_type:complete